MEKLDELRSILSAMGSVAVAFSGGVDSSLLLAVAHEVLGDANCLAVCVDTEVFTAAELALAKGFCAERSIPLEVVPMSVFEIPGFIHNPPERCYICKRHLLGGIQKVADAYGLKFVVEGSNLDDLDDWRPGRRAVLESGVASPLLEAGLTKAEVREASRELGLPNADAPAQACLATRFAFGELLSIDALRRVEKAELALHAMGLGLLRVRVNGRSARIETDERGLGLLSDPDFYSRVLEQVLSSGFGDMEVDPAGYRQGSMNRAAGS